MTPPMTDETGRSMKANNAINRLLTERQGIALYRCGWGLS